MTIEPKAPYADCAHCPLVDQPCVPSYTPPGAILMVVGEAPGRDEVSSGKPFTGPSGQLLDKALTFAGIGLDQVAKTNVVLCRPEGNATPPDRAVRACAARLAAELNRTAPTVLALGGVAHGGIKGLSHKASETYTDRGQWFTVGHIDVLPTLHPAYVLRQPDQINTLLTDVGRARER